MQRTRFRATGKDRPGRLGSEGAAEGWLGVMTGGTATTFRLSVWVMTSPAIRPSTPPRSEARPREAIHRQECDGEHVGSGPGS
jgi:hypothetical protein